MYFFEEYQYDQLELLKKDWEELAKGKDMTIYQSYDWYLMLRSYSLKDNILHSNTFAVCRNEHMEIVLIAPLWILHHSIWWPFNRKGIYLLGRDASSDYLNLIYSNFQASAFDFLLLQLSRKYHIHTFKFELLKEGTALYNHIKKKTIIRDHRLLCVSLNLPASEEDYLKILSKSSKQNLRTANNRLNKDGKQIVFVLDDIALDKSLCLKIKNSRLKKKNYEPKKTIAIKNWLFKKLTIGFPKYNPFLTDVDTHIMSAYCDGELAAFFNYGIDPYRNCIYIFTAGTNETFARYSPGMLLMYEYIKHIITNNKEYSVIDFTRGNEHYKYALGGENHIIHSIRFIVKNDS